MSVYDAGLVCTHRSSIKFVHFVHSQPLRHGELKRHYYDFQNYANTRNFP